MKARLVDFDTWRQECDLLIQMHFLEVLAPRGYHFGMEDDFFRQMGETLRIVVVYDENVTPMGYAKTIVSEDLYDDSALVAQTSAFFLHPDHRKGMAGVKLLRAAQADLQAVAPGARWRLAVPLDGVRDFGKVMERFLDFAPLERVYQKTLPGGSE